MARGLHLHALGIKHLCLKITKEPDDLMLAERCLQLSEWLETMLAEENWPVSQGFWRQACVVRYSSLADEYRAKSADAIKASSWGLLEVIKWASEPRTEKLVRAQAVSICEALSRAYEQTFGTSTFAIKPRPVLPTYLGRRYSERAYLRLITNEARVQ